MKKVAFLLSLAAALNAADLVETLKGKGPFTVFAPTDEAFSKLPEGTVEELLKPENKEKLAGILTYHVVAGKVMAADVVKLSSAKSVQGCEVTIKTELEMEAYPNAHVAGKEIPEYIRYYNTRRRRAALGYWTPEACETMISQGAHGER